MPVAFGNNEGPLLVILCGGDEYFPHLDGFCETGCWTGSSFGLDPEGGDGGALVQNLADTILSLPPPPLFFIFAATQ